MTQGITLLIIGNEILAGRRQDCHFEHTLTACQQRDIRIDEVRYLRDDQRTLYQAFRQVVVEQRNVVSFGGIGATPDDKTREAVAQATGRPLVFHPEGIALLMAKYGDTLNDARRQLVYFPQDATLIPNPINGIPGFSIGNIHCVPGFPQMAQPMVAWVLDTYGEPLRQPLQYHAVHASLVESQAIELLLALERDFPDLSISCLPKMQHGLELGFEGNGARCAIALKACQAWLSANGYAWTTTPPSSSNPIIQQ